MSQHGERAHSKYSASGSERWKNCPGSVKLSEGMPDKETEWSREGTQAHEVLEALLLWMRDLKRVPQELKSRPREMFQHGEKAADFIIALAAKLRAEVLVETRIYLDFIHPEMFGTFDGAVLDHFGTLHVFDYKYGAGHAVSPKENLQMIFYAIGLAHKFHWNFKRVRMWIIQPRIKGYDGPAFWEISILELRAYVAEFKHAVHQVETKPDLLKEGSWCHWCKAKSKCPVKQAARVDKAVALFQANPIQKGNNDGEKESKDGTQKSEADWRKEARRKKGRKEKVKEESEDFF